MKKIVVPTLTADTEEATGGIKFPAAWRRVDSFTRLDILQDWIAELNAEYALAHEEQYPGSAAETAEMIAMEDEYDMQTERLLAHPLGPVLFKAIEQATSGKGKRHGGDETPFLEQPWVHYANMHGRGFLTGQAAKKLEEAASTRTGEAFETEMLGAIVYCGMALLKEGGLA